MRYAIIICENKMTMMIMVMTNGMKYVEACGCVVAEAGIGNCPACPFINPALMLAEQVILLLHVDYS